MTKIKKKNKYQTRVINKIGLVNEYVDIFKMFK